MGEPEPERRRQTKQKLRRPQGAGIWPEAVPRTEGQIRITTFLNSPLQVSPRSTKTMINRKNRLSNGRGLDANRTDYGGTKSELLHAAASCGWPFVATLPDRVPVGHAKSNKRAARKLEASRFDRDRYDTAPDNSLGRPRIELGAERERLLQVLDEDPYFGRQPAACRSNRKDWHSSFIRS